MDLDDSPTTEWRESPDIAPYAYVNPAFGSLARNAPAGTLSADAYRNWVRASVESRHEISYVVNAMVSHEVISRDPEALQRFLRQVENGLDGRYRGRVAVVVGVNGGEKSATKLAAKKAAMRGAAAAKIHTAIQNAAKSTTSSLPLALVPTPLNPWPENFPYGTARNTLLVSDTNRKALRALMARGTHPYVAFMDFDDYPHLTPDGTHIFAQLDAQLRSEGAATSTTGSTDGAEFAEPITGPQGEEGFRILTPEEIAAQPPESVPPLRPLMMSGGYVAPADPEGRKRLVEETEPRVEQANRESREDYEKKLKAAAKTPQSKAPRQPTILTAPADGDDPRLLEFDHAVARDMRTRDRQVRIAPQLPYSPEPNLFVDGVAVLLESTGVGPIRFGTGGGEFHELSESLMELAAWEITQELGIGNTPATHTTPYADEYEETIAPLRIAAENLAPPTRGTAFHVAFTRNATQTDLSRLLTGALGGPLPQDHGILPNPMARLFNRGEGDAYTARGPEVRAMRSGLSLAPFRDGVNGDPSTGTSAKDPLAPVFRSGTVNRSARIVTGSASNAVNNQPPAETAATELDPRLGDPQKQRISRALSRAIPGHTHLWAGLAPTQMRLHAHQLALSDDTSTFLRHMRLFARLYLVRPRPPAPEGGAGARLAAMHLTAAGQIQKPRGSFFAALTQALQPRTVRAPQAPAVETRVVDGAASAQIPTQRPLTWDDDVRSMLGRIYLQYRSDERVKGLISGLASRGTTVEDFFVRLTTGRLHPFAHTLAEYAAHGADRASGAGFAPFTALDGTAALLLFLYAEALARPISLTAPDGTVRTVRPTRGRGSGAPGLHIRWDPSNGGWVADRPTRASQDPPQDPPGTPRTDSPGGPGKRERPGDDANGGRRNPQIQRGLSLMADLSLGDNTGPDSGAPDGSNPSGSSGGSGNRRSALSNATFTRLTGRPRGSTSRNERRS
ncbi:hypothetical protein GUY61_30115 [Streptomyces sp. GC420]|nr:hypothetical protein [Streptomyces sp. GC420]